MYKTNYNRLKKIHRILLYIIFAVVGYLLLAVLISAAGLYEFPFRETETINVAIFLTAFIPMLILSAILILLGHPSDYYELQNPFPSQERFDNHFKVKLDGRKFEEPIVLLNDAAMKITIRRKSVLNRVEIFAFVQAADLDASSESLIRKSVTAYLMQTGDFTGKTSLTLLLGIDTDSKYYATTIKDFGRDLPMHVVVAGFDFGQGKMSFHGKIDGLVAGRRKRMLKALLSMMPEAQKYLDQEFLEGKERIDRDKVVLPVNPKKIPSGIRVLWSLSCLGIAVTSFLIGTILVNNDGLLFGFFAALLFIYAFLMIGIGVYQLKKAFARDDESEHN